MPVFLFHTTGMAIGRGLSYAFTGRPGEREVPDRVWWRERPLSIAVSLSCTLPVIWLFGRVDRRRPTVPAPA
ncbi:hypothetical protein ACQP04_13775 [Pseudonocardia halophobica]|uniref:hypothetical protein n=1 Tax=Pseudonocardia halophobica TaxID=29401 RepID=UPI003D93CF04